MTRRFRGAARLNRSPKQREASSPAQRCNVACILRTMTLAVKSSGQATAPGFPGASSDITFPSLTDTLPPFPMYAAFPRSEYYGGSAPPAPSAGVAPIPARPSWQEGGRGTHADGSHVHCGLVGGLDTRLYPCAIASGYFGGIHPGLPDRAPQPPPEHPPPSYSAGTDRHPPHIPRRRPV